MYRYHIDYFKIRLNEMSIIVHNKQTGISEVQNFLYRNFQRCEITYKSIPMDPLEIVSFNLNP